MSTGDFNAGQPNFYQEGFNRPQQNDFNRSGDNGDEPNYFQSQFNTPDFSDVRRDAYQVNPRGQTLDYQLPRDGAGYPIINYGTINIIENGGGGAGSGDWQYQQYCKLKDMTSGRYDNWDNRDNFQPMRRSDYVREQLIRDGQIQDRMIRSSFSNDDCMYDRNYGPFRYDRPGQYTSYSHGGRDGLSYYQSGPTYNRMPPFVNDDCFGTGNGRDNGMQVLNDMLRMGLSYDIARRYAGHHQPQNRWDGYAYDGYRQGMNPIDMMLMNRAINGNSWNRYSPRMYDQYSTNYTHGGPDGLSFFNQTPSYDNWNGPRSGFEQVLGNVLPLAQDYLAYDIARRSVPRYESYRNVQPYYDNNSQREMQMAQNRAFQQQQWEQREQQMAMNRQQHRQQWEQRQAQIEQNNWRHRHGQA